MIKALGIDYGLSHIGLSYSEGPLAEPLTTKTYQQTQKLINYLKDLNQKLQVDLVVIGLSEGKMLHQTLNFSQKLKKALDVKIVFQDETLTTKQAQEKLIQSQAKKSKRKKFQHAAAAAIILQNYLDTHLKDC